MSVVGRRGSSESGWSWSRPPQAPYRPPPRPPLLPLAGAVFVILLAIVALLLIFRPDSDDNSTAGAATPSPTAVAPPTTTPSPTPAPTPIPSPTPSPTPIPSPVGALFRLAAWDGQRWLFDSSPQSAAYQEGEAIPLLLRIDNATPRTVYHLILRYDCNGFDLLTTHNRDAGNEPVLAPDGPGSAIADSVIRVPDDPATTADDDESGSLNLWGGSFASTGAPLPSSACAGEKTMAVSLLAATDAVFFMWAAQLSQTASDADTPLRVAVQTPSGEDLSIAIDPTTVGEAGP